MPNSEQITTEEDWQITCHEAGHAVVAARFGFGFCVIRGYGAVGQVQAWDGPLDKPDQSWTQEELSQWQQFYAAGDAAERLLFGEERAHAGAADRDCHQRLQKMRNETETDSWERDVKMAMNVLDGESVNKVAHELEYRRTTSDDDVGGMSDDDVRAILGIAARLRCRAQ